MQFRFRNVYILIAAVLSLVFVVQVSPISAQSISQHDVSGGSEPEAQSLASRVVDPWMPLPHRGLNGRVHAMVVFGGDLYVGGAFTGTADGQVMNLNNIARLHEGEWYALPNDGLTGGLVKTLYVAGDTLYVGGAFTGTGDGTVADLNRIAKFEDGAWSALPNGGFDSDVETMVEDGGALYVGGNFVGTADGTVENLNSIAVLDGGVWSALPNRGLNGPVKTLAFHDNRLFVGGEFAETADGTVKDLNHFAYLENGGWNAAPEAGLNGPVYALLSRGKFLFVGGDFSQTMNGTVITSNLARFDGEFSGVRNGGLDGPVYSLTATSGLVWVGGNFDASADGKVKNLGKVAIYDEARWYAAPRGGLNAGVRAFAVLKRNLYMGGDFVATADEGRGDLVRGAVMPLGANLKSDQSVQQAPDGAYEITLALKNRGPARARNLRIVDSIPAQYSVVRARGEGGFACAVEGQDVNCRADVLVGGEEGKVVVVIRANGSGPTSVNNCAQFLTTTFDPTSETRACGRISPTAP